MYAFNTQEQRKEIWLIEDTCNKISGNFLLGGDFNNVLLVDGRLNGNPVTQQEIHDFAECLLLNNLSEVRTIGEYYTWCNNQASGDRIYSKIDRFIASTTWLHNFSATVGEVYPKGVYDHFHISKDLVCPTNPRNTPFWFLNVLTEHQLFPTLIQDKWGQNLHSNLLINIWRKLKALKEDLKELSTKYFQDTTKKVEDARNALTVAQSHFSSDPLNSDLIEEEKM